MDMTNFMEAGDGISVMYVSGDCDTHGEAKKPAVQEVMCFLLGFEPNKVKLAPKCFRNKRSIFMQVSSYRNVK